MTKINQCMASPNLFPLARCTYKSILLTSFRNASAATAAVKLIPANYTVEANTVRRKPPKRRKIVQEEAIPIPSNHSARNSKAKVAKGKVLQALTEAAVMMAEAKESNQEEAKSKSRKPRKKARPKNETNYNENLDIAPPPILPKKSAVVTNADLLDEAITEIETAKVKSKSKKPQKKARPKKKTNHDEKLDIAPPPIVPKLEVKEATLPLIVDRRETAQEPGVNSLIGEIETETTPKGPKKKWIRQKLSKVEVRARRREFKAKADDKTESLLNLDQELEKFNVEIDRAADQSNLAAALVTAHNLKRVTQPNVATYYALLKACAACGAFGIGWDLIKDMESMDLKPDLDCFNLLLKVRLFLALTCVHND